MFRTVLARLLSLYMQRNPFVWHGRGDRFISDLISHFSFHYFGFVQAAYVTVTVPYVLMFALFIRGITLEGAGDGIRYYITPNVTRLLEPAVNFNIICEATNLCPISVCCKMPERSI